MRKFIIIIICLLFVKVSYSLDPNELNNNLLLTSNNIVNTNVTLSSNYQQFKFQLINLESENHYNFSYHRRRRRKKNDNLMLYVAGGLAVATTTLILTNNPENFTSNSTTGVNLGIAAGGTIACGMIVAKFFIDKSR